jgi:hypothetical protein
MRLARAHVGILVLVALAALLRLAVMLAYRPAFWYTDSSSYILASRVPLTPHYSRPLGYVLLLEVLERTNTHVAVVAVQHLLGLALGVAVYAFLRRRGVSGWLGFAMAAIRQQPGDYARVVARDVAPFFLPWWPIGPDTRCLLGRWTLPETTRDPTPYLTHCHADLAVGDFRPDPADSATAAPANALTRALHWYSTYVRTPVLAVAAVFLLAAAGALLIVLPVMVSMYETRYAAPALPLLAMAGALAGHHLRAAYRQQAAEAAAGLPVEHGGGGPHSP